MGYFSDGSIEDEILADCEYMQRQKNASDIQIIKALIMEVRKYKDMHDLIENCPHHSIIGENLIKAWAKINSSLYDKIVCTISGGADSDVVLDIVWRCDISNKVTYVWFDTGLEYEATKEHLVFLENKYGIKIERHRAKKPIPLACKEYGQPFISKYVSEMIQRLQRHNFKWEDRPFDELIKEYPSCKVALQWWCNCNKSDRFNISRNKHLKEFMMANPPKEKISNKCCWHGKKDLIHKIISKGEYDLEINGVRRAEGGIRDVAYKTCFDSNGDWDRYRPVFWYKDDDRRLYEEHYGVTHSRCYTEYGLKRTGCAGCPFGKRFETEIEVVKKHEPKLHRGILSVFGYAYAYSRLYHNYCSEMKEREG